jgi:hypothetical protein
MESIYVFSLVQNNSFTAEALRTQRDQVLFGGLPARSRFGEGR